MKIQTVEKCWKLKAGQATVGKMIYRNCRYSFYLFKLINDMLEGNKKVAIVTSRTLRTSRDIWCIVTVWLGNE